MTKQWLRIRSGRHSSDHLVELTKEAGEFKQSEVVEAEVRGQKRSFNVEIPATGTKLDPLYVA